MRNALFLPLVLATAALALVGLRAAADEPAAKHGQGADGHSQKGGRGAGAGRCGGETHARVGWSLAERRSRC